MKKILYVTHRCSFSVNRFWISSINAAHELGMEFHLACNLSGVNKEHWDKDCKRYGIVAHHIDFDRNPHSFQNTIAYRQMKLLLSENDFEIIHCNTPVGGVVTRLAAHAVKTSDVIYQAHGFHFYKGAPLLNWLVYYPIEWFLSRYTDVLMTINKEDYVRAQKFAAKKVYYVPGVGIDTKRFAASDEVKSAGRHTVRTELGISLEALVLLSVGEVNKNKNHRVVIEALSKIENKNTHYVVCGRGPLEESHKELARKLGVADRVHLLGYRTDVADFYHAADVFVFPSLREGLPVAVMEAMASGLPVICNDIRGCSDLIEDGTNGYCLQDCTADAYAKAIGSLNYPGCHCIAGKNILKAKAFDLDIVTERYRDVYCGK